MDPYPNIDIGSLRGTPVISQDDEEDTSHPAGNTRQQHQIRTLTQDYMLHMMEIPGYTTPFSPKQAASRTFPLQFLCDLQSSMTTPATYSSTATSSSIQNTRTHGITHSERTTTETIFFINKTDIPQDQKGGVTYGQIVCVYREGKKDKHRTRITMGGNLINYPGECGTPAADLLTVKLLFNSIISTPNVKFMSIDIKDFYLCTPMKR